MTNQLSIFDEKPAIVLDIKQARQARDEGIKRAERKANKDNAGWSNKAFEKIKEFLEVHRGEFLCENLRAFAAMDDDFELPEKSQAWAGPLGRAKAKGLIEFVRWEPTKNSISHGRPGSVWRQVKKQS